MADVVQLAAPPKIEDTIAADVIRYLKEILKEAEEGRIESIIIIAKRPSGFWSERRSGTKNYPEAIGRLEIMKQGWIQEFLQDVCDE